jgi:PEGA domain-containing protein
VHGALLLSRVLLVLDPAAPAAWAEDARRALRADRDVAIVEPDAAGAARVRAEDRARLEEAHGCASVVRARYTGGDFAAMAAEAERCETDHADALATREGRPVLVDLLLSRGLASLGLGDAAAARAAFARAVAIDPDARLDAGLFPPAAAIAFAEARSAALSAPRAEAVVRTEPAGAIVTVDGATLGPSPATALLLPTDHLVRADLPGYRPKVVCVDPLGMGAVVTLEALSGDEARAHASAWLEAGGGARDASTLRAIAKALGADAAILLAENAAQGRPEATLYRLPTGSESRLGDRDEGAGEVVERVLHPPPPPRQAPTQPPAPSDDRGLFGRWWFWTAAGAVALGAAAAVLAPTLFPPDRHVRRYGVVFQEPQNP